jgi:branched-chain amino acid aminotransferase
MLQTYDERNRTLLVNINGSLVHREEAGVSPFDSSVQNGDAVWEGLRVYDGRIFRLREHLARLRKSAEMLAYASIPDDAMIIHEVSRTLAANNMRDGVHIRLMLTRGVKYTSGLDPRLNTAGHSLLVLAEFKSPVYSTAGVRLITARHRRPSADVLDQRIHSANQLTSILAKIEANVAGADDALMLDTRGFVAETNATHLFFVFDSAVHTPRTVACPEGITRAVVLEICEELGLPSAVRDIAPDEIAVASEVFCSGTMGEIVPVVGIDTLVFPADGSITRQIQERFREQVTVEGERVVD